MVKLLSKNLPRLLNSNKFKLSFQVGDIFIDIKTNSDFIFRVLNSNMVFPLASQVKHMGEVRPSIYYKVDYENSFYPIFARVTPANDLLLVWKEQTKHHPALVFLQQNKQRVFYIIPASRLKDFDNIKIPFILPVKLLLSSRKYLIFHASCVVKDKQGILIAGPTKSGKTTVAFYLTLKKGFDFISNDMVLLTSSPGGIKAIGVIAPIGVRRGAFKLFPETRRYVKNRERGLGYVNPEEMFQDRLRKEAIITHIYFPKPSSQVKNLHQLTPLEVLHELIPNAGVVPIKTMMDERLDLLGKPALSTKSFYIPWRRGRLPKLPTVL